jgi:hypothetical protein
MNALIRCWVTALRVIVFGKQVRSIDFEMTPAQRRRANAAVGSG